MERHIVTVEQPSQDWEDALEKRLSIMVAAQVKEAIGTRAIADGLKLALHELAEGDAPTLKRTIVAIGNIVGDGTSKWLGAKILAAAAAGALGFLLWLGAKKW